MLFYTFVSNTRTGAEIEMTVEIINYYKQEPNFSITTSDMDYYGYTELDYEVIDYAIYGKGGDEIISGQGEPPKEFGYNKDALEKELVDYIEYTKSQESDYYP